MILNYKKEEEILNDKAKFYAKELWNLELDIPVILNGKLKRRMGSLVCKNKIEVNFKPLPLKIEIAKDLLEPHYNKYHIDDVLIHELCHWYCIKIDKPSDDGSKFFEEELIRIGSHKTQSIKVSGEYHFTKCSKCGKKTTRNRTYNQAIKYTNEKKYSSQCCRAKIDYAGIIFVKDEYKPTDKLKELVDKYYLKQKSC